MQGASPPPPQKKKKKKKKKNEEGCRGGSGMGWVGGHFSYSLLIVSSASTTEHTNQLFFFSFCL